MHDTNGDLKMDTKELVTDRLRPPGGRRRGQRQRVLLGPGQLDLHSAGSSVNFSLRLKDGKFETSEARSRAASGA